MAGKKEKITRIFQMDLDTLELFFDTVTKMVALGYKDTKELRMEIMNELLRQGKMERAYETKRTKEQVIKDFRKQGFNVKDYTKRDNDGNLQ